MKIMISYPPLSGDGTPTLGQNRQFQWFHNPSFIYPMVPASAATLLKSKGYEVVWDDSIAAKRTYQEWEENVIKENPDFIAFETKTPVVKQHWGIISKLKEKLPALKTVLMGDHVTAMPEETMKNSSVDFVLTGGDYDFLLLNILEFAEKKSALEPGIWFRADNGIKNTGKFRLEHDLNSLPFIDRDLTHWKMYGEKFSSA
jgi:hypothetical protein